VKELITAAKHRIYEQNLLRNKNLARLKIV